jgi:hypothetical protein
MYENLSPKNYLKGFYYKVRQLNKFKWMSWVLSFVWNCRKYTLGPGDSVAVPERFITIPVPTLRKFRCSFRIRIQTRNRIQTIFSIFFSHIKFLQNLACLMLETALFHRKLSSHFVNDVVNDGVCLLFCLLNILYTEHKHSPRFFTGLRTKTEERKKSRYKGDYCSTILFNKSK